MSENRKPLLQVEDINVYYGAIHAIKGISFEVYPDEIVTLIGANGAGKSTTLNTIAGLLRPRSGRIILEGKDLATIPASRIVSQGMAHVPRGAAYLPADDRAGKSGNGRLHPPQVRRFPPPWRRCSPASPA